MTRFPGIEATILRTLLEEGEVRPPEGILAQEYFWQAAAQLQACGLCVPDQHRCVLETAECSECGGSGALSILDADGMERATFPCSRCGGAGYDRATLTAALEALRPKPPSPTPREGPPFGASWGSAPIELWLERQRELLEELKGEGA